MAFIYLLPTRLPLAILIPLAVVACVPASANSAEQLPSSLVLRCQGEAKTQKYFPVLRPPVSFENTSFSITIEIKNGKIFDVSKNELLGDDV